MTKQEMIEAIYTKIANKTLNEWCNIINNRLNSKKKSKIVRVKDEWVSFISCDSHSIYKEKLIWFDKYHKIIWHPVMLWDVLDYFEDKVWPAQYDFIFQYWKYKRKPIEEQSKECIIYIFDLLKNGN